MPKSPDIKLEKLSYLELNSTKQVFLISGFIYFKDFLVLLKPNEKILSQNFSGDFYSEFKNNFLW